MSTRNVNDIAFSTDNDLSELTNEARKKLLTQAYKDIRQLVGIITRLRAVTDSGVRAMTRNNAKLAKALDDLQPGDAKDE
jgi:chromosomal replication initiation ATPase DnaA